MSDEKKDPVQEKRDPEVEYYTFVLGLFESGVKQLPAAMLPKIRVERESIKRGDPSSYGLDVAKKALSKIPIGFFTIGQDGSWRDADEEEITNFIKRLEKELNEKKGGDNEIGIEANTCASGIPVDTRIDNGLLDNNETSGKDPGSDDDVK